MPGKSNKLHAVISMPIDIATAAEHLGVSHKTVRRLIADGKLPAFRVGGKAIRVYPEHVEALKIPVAVSD